MNAVVKNVLKEMPGGSPSNLLFPARDGSVLKETSISKTFPRSVNALELNKNVTDDRQKVVFHS